MVKGHNNCGHGCALRADLQRNSGRRNGKFGCRASGGVADEISSVDDIKSTIKLPEMTPINVLGSSLQNSR